MIRNVENNLNAMRKKEFYNKFVNVMRRNPGFETLKKISEILSDGENVDDEFIESFSPNELYSFKYCPDTSCDVERSFSKYRAMFTDNRKSFLFENLKKYLIVNCSYIVPCEDE